MDSLADVLSRSRIDATTNHSGVSFFLGGEGGTFFVVLRGNQGEQATILGVPEKNQKTKNTHAYIQHEAPLQSAGRSIDMGATHTCRAFLLFSRGTKGNFLTVRNQSFSKRLEG